MYYKHYYIKENIIHEMEGKNRKLQILLSQNYAYKKASNIIGALNVKRRDGCIQKLVARLLLV